MQMDAPASGSETSKAISALRRFVRPPVESRVEDRCELCRTRLHPFHRHLLDPATRQVLCACDPCALRFQSVVNGKFRLIPRDARSLPGFTLTDAQLFTDYLVRLIRYVEFMKRVVPLHDDLFDFFYQALPGYEEVGRRRILLGCWGSFQDPDVCDYRYQTMDKWGEAMFVTPEVVVDGELVTTKLVDINLNIRILLGSSYYEDWNNSETFVKTDPLGNPVDQRHPWNQTTIPKPQARHFEDKYTWVMSPRWLDQRTGDHLALDTGGGPIARL